MPVDATMYLQWRPLPTSPMVHLTPPLIENTTITTDDTTITAHTEPLVENPTVAADAGADAGAAGGAAAGAAAAAGGVAAGAVVLNAPPPDPLVVIALDTSRSMADTVVKEVDLAAQEAVNKALVSGNADQIPNLLLAYKAAGDTIIADNVAKIATDVAKGTAPTSAPKSKNWLWLLILAGGAAAYWYSQKKRST